MSLPESLVLVDVETTGANPVRDRITEIAILRIAGGELVERWESLVNPGCTIPPLIQRLIGITDEMVATAPSFADIADEVRARLDGAVFVAHNARFDYGFLRNEFARVEREFEAPVLCTVKFSRALFPEHHRHGLDALIERHGLHCAARHRAMGDTEALWQFLRLARGQFSAEVLARATERAMKVPPRPAQLPDGVLEGLPESPGVYYLYGENDQLLYIGRAASLRARVTEQLDPRAKGRDGELVKRVRRVECEECAGELDAQLRETALLRERCPPHNRPLATGEEAFGLQYVAGRKRPPVLQRVPLAGSDPADWSDVHGAFRTRKEAESLLRELARAYRLCPRRLGLEGGQGACSAHAAGSCAGVCAKRERPEAHDERLLGALGGVRLRPWPWGGAVLIAEHSTHHELRAWHLIDRWCHLGTVTSEAEVSALCAAPPPRRFDLDVYRILTRWLAAESNRESATPL